MSVPTQDFYDRNYHGRRHVALIEDEEYFRARSEASARLYFSPWEREKAIFEYGCGIGQGIASLPNAAGWDLSGEARELCRRRGLKIFDKLEDVPAGRWDIVFCRHVLEHIPEPLAALRNMRRLVKREGEIYLVLPREKHFRCAFEPDLNQHLYCWTFRTINNLLHLAGFCPCLNRYRRVLGYRRLLPLRRIFGKTVYHYATLATGHVFNNAEIIVRAKLREKPSAALEPATG